MNKEYKKYYDSLKKLTKEYFSFHIDYHCPSCYGDKFLVSSDRDRFECLCGWEGKRESLMARGEYKDKLRTELIDKILDE